MRSIGSEYRITLPQFTFSFVPFALLLGAALLAAETTQRLDFYRTVYTIWATAVLVTPALCAFALPGDSPVKSNVWLLFWTFSFIVYIVHLLYAVLGVYHGSFREFIDGQGWFPALNNVVFTAWWTFDLALAWFYRSEQDWVWKQRVAAHIYIGGTFVLATVVLKHGFINVIGVTMTLALLVCLVIRYDHARGLRRKAHGGIVH